MRRLLIGVAVLFAMGGAGTALAGSRCDDGVAKAIGKKTSCECSEAAKADKKGAPVDFSKCSSKFSVACMKAKSLGNCVKEVKSCSTYESDIDTFVASECKLSGSPSGAFLE